MSIHILSRRNFITTAAASIGAMAFGSVIPHSVLGANDRINFGIIGLGSNGSSHLKSLVNRSKEDNISVVAVSEVYRKRLTQGMNICKGDGYIDYRKMLDRKDIDAVIISTPDHWHSKMSIDALDAGKHVYCEKPMTLTVEQAIEVRNAARKQKKVFQVGPQRTAQEKYRKAHELIREGRMGKISWAQCSWNRNYRGSDVYGSAYRIDETVGPHMTGENYIDWDMWLGHEWGLAPKVPWIPDHFFNYRGYFRYNGGIATDMLYHFLAPLLIAISGENGEYPHRVNACGGRFVNKTGREVPDVFLMTADYPSEYSVFLESVLTNETLRPMEFYGRYATMEIHEYESDFTITGLPSFINEFREMNNGYDTITVNSEDKRDMEGNFIDVIRYGGKLFCNVELGCSTMVALKMGVESLRQSKTMIWDAENEKVIPG